MTYVNIFKRNSFEKTAEIDTKNRTHKKHARVAQWLEHWSSKPGVDSSILSSGIENFIFFLFCYFTYTPATDSELYFLRF